MSVSMVLKTTKNTLEEVTENVFKVKDKIVNEDGSARYTGDYFFFGADKTLEVSGKIDSNTFALLGRKFGVNAPTTSKIEDCPPFLFIQQKKNQRKQILCTKTGETYKK